MTNRNPNGNGRFTGELAGARVRQTMPPSLVEDRRVSAHFEPSGASHETAGLPIAGNARRRDWQMAALWIFVTVSFAALAVTGYLLWAKCRGVSPF